MENYTILKSEMRPRSNGRNERWVLFRCFCGNEKWARLWKLKQPRMKSCGCLPKFVPPPFPITHGMSNSREYNTWGGMIARCTNPKDDHWYLYGGRGIQVCERWLKFENFYSDMGPKPKGLTIDRINNDGNYEPENCRWATSEEQKINRRNTLYISIGGQKILLKDWAKANGMKYGVAAYRFGFAYRLPKKRTLMHLLDNFP